MRNTLSAYDVVLCIAISALSAMAAVTASAAEHSAGNESQPAARTGPICVAVLEPEILADLPEADRKALAAALDTLLTESLAGRKEFVLVDRTLLDKVLSEKAAGLANATKVSAGVARVSPAEVAEPLRPFWAAGVMVCSQLDAKAGRIMIEAVSAQTGQLIAELYLSSKAASAEDINKALSPRLRQFAEAVPRGVARNRNKPLLEISGKLTGGLTRLAWMVDALTDAAGAKVAASGNVVWLVPRQPLVTKEERLLRVMGLAEARKGDAAAGLSPVSQMRLTFELTDSAKTGVTFEKTPILLKLSLRRGQDKPIEKQIDGEAGQWDACRDKASNWLAAQLAATDGAAPLAGDQTERARQLAKEELAVVAEWSSLKYSAQRDIDRQLRIQMYRRAARAAHLDPTNEQAAYLLATSVEAQYDKTHKIVGLSRAVIESRRYLDRFGKQVPDHHRDVLHILGSHGMLAVFTLTEGRAPQTEPLSFPPDEQMYSYARHYVRAIAEYGCLGRFDELYNDTNNFDIFGYHLVRYLVPNCPDDSLAEEYAWWKEFYRTTFAEASASTKGRSVTGSGPPAPWALVEAAFAVRRKDVQNVRAALQEMARMYPENLTRVWGGDEYRERIVPAYLKAAGDPEWNTWKPDFSRAKPVANIAYEEMSAFMSSLRPRFPSAAPAAPPLKAPGLRLAVPEDIRRLSKPSPGWPLAESILLVDNEVWVMVPGPYAAGPVHRGPSVLYRAALTKPNGADINLSLEPLPWPKHPDAKEGEDKYKIQCQLVQTGAFGSTVWLGTDRGLARFDRAEGRQWKGRWYAGRDGFPGEKIESILPAKSGEDDVLLLRSSQQSFTLNAKNGRCVILPKPLCPSSIMKLRDGRLALMELISRGLYGNVKLEDIVASTAGVPQPFAAVKDEAGKTAVWYGEWEWEVRKCHLLELSLATGRPQRDAFSGQQIGAFPYQSISDLFWGGALVVTEPPAFLSATPYFLPGFMVGEGEIIWMAAEPPGHSGSATRIIGLRPGTSRPAAKRGAAPATATDSSDVWIGPLATPDGRPILNMHAVGNGKMLVTTADTYMMDCSELLEAATKAGRIVSSDALRAKADERLAAAGWQAQVPAMILREQWADALKTLDERQLAIRPDQADAKDEAVRLTLWKAQVLARMPDGLDKSIEQYRSVAETPADSPCARVFARINQVYLLHKAGRYEEMLSLVERVCQEFPQVKPDNDNAPLNWYINDARKKLAEQAHPAPATTERKP